MEEERYPGERRGLRLFLEELLPAIGREGAAQFLLVHAIRRALDSGELRHLRHARQIFNHLPRLERRALSTAMLGPRTQAIPEGRSLPERRRPPSVCFEAARDEAGRNQLRVEFREQRQSEAEVQVMIEPGTLPSVAADALRRIAATIEADRRLLSARFWRQEGLKGEQREVR